MRQSLIWVLGVLVLYRFAGPGSAADNRSSTASDTLTLLFEENFADGLADQWQPNIPANWRVVECGDRYVYELVERGPDVTPRRPTSYSILTPYDVTSFELIVEAKCLTDSTNPYRDLCLFFGFQDSVHFYYTHFACMSDGAHNIIGLVDEADRVKINREPVGSSEARLRDNRWHRLKIRRDVDTGTIEAFIDDMTTPMLTTVDTTFNHGKIGVGSFDDVGYFTGLKLWGRKYESTNVRKSELETPHIFELAQNYPNPFNGSTNIEVVVPSLRHVSLNVLNIAGQEVSSLIFGRLSKGTHRFVWDASDMASGYYFCSLRSGDRTRTIPMLLIR